MKLSRWRWVMVGFAFLATVINYLDRQTLSVAAPALREEFHLSNVAYSRVIFGFLLAYTIMNGVSGALIDRLGSKVGYAICVAWWSAAAMLHAFAQGALSLWFFRFLLGMGEAGNWPAAIKVVAEWFPAKERALACGLFNSGSAVGAILAPPLVAWVLLQFGWRMAFILVGVTGFVWLAAWLAFYREPPAVSPDAAGDEAPAAAPIRLSVGQLLRTRFVVCFMIAKVFMDPVWYFYIFWFPEYLKHARNFNMADIGKYAWIPFFIASAGNLLGGLLSGWLLRRDYSVTVARKASVTFFAVLMSAAIPAVLVQDASVSIAFVSVAMLGYTGCASNMLAMPADVFPGNAVASVYGLASMGSGFGGMLFTLITGWVVDHFSYTPVFFGFGVMPLICVLILWVFLGPLRPLLLVKQKE
ncbi:MAG: MFS transporter [Undibacterium sp.]|nr:MFS transporter [Opitutaceae bacterium]